MAIYKNSIYLTQSLDTAFDVIYNPGAEPSSSGIFRCPGCGREVVAEQGRQLPPQNHHQHTVTQGTVRWKMIVKADHQAK